VVPAGKDEPRLVAFATTLARARFAVLAPDLPGYRQLRIHPSDARIVADAFAYLAGQPELAPAGRVGLAAFSYGVGPALLAALEEDLRERMRFVVAVGGYHDLTRAARYLTTGYFQAEERWQYLAPNDYGKLVLVSTARSYVETGDARVFERMIERRLKDRAADLSDLAERLGPSGRAVYALAVNADPGRFAALYTALPQTMRADMAALSLHDRDLTRLRTRLILVHGRNDNLIPWPESAALAAAVPPSQARLYLLHSVLGHVDLRLSHVLSWRFLTRELPDIFSMWCAVDTLLAERQTHESPF
jgi:pimeloyl-ACP methyl ester carboxylesterase